jgi:hypothetical protein
MKTKNEEMKKIISSFFIGIILALIILFTDLWLGGKPDGFIAFFIGMFSVLAVNFIVRTIYG